MKQHSNLNTGQLHSDVKVTASKELEEKMKNIKSSPVKLEKAMKAIKRFDSAKIRAMQYSK